MTRATTDEGVELLAISSWNDHSSGSSSSITRSQLSSHSRLCARPHAASPTRSNFHAPMIASSSASLPAPPMSAAAAYDPKNSTSGWSGSTAAAAAVATSLDSEISRSSKSPLPATPDDAMVFRSIGARPESPMSAVTPRRPPSVNPTLQLDPDIVSTYSELKQSVPTAWIVIGYSPQGQQLPLSPSTSPDASPQIGMKRSDSVASNATAASTSFRLHIQARSPLYRYNVELDEVVADVRTALVRDHVQWLVLRCNGSKVICVQVFDGDVSGLRRARALVHGRSLSSALHGSQSLLHVPSITAITPAWLMAKLAAPTPPMLQLATQRSSGKDDEDEDDGIPWTGKLQPPPPPPSPGPPAVPAKDKGQPALPIDVDQQEVLTLSPPLQSQERPFSWSSRYNAPTIEATEDLQDLQDQWSQSAASLRESQSTPSSLLPPEQLAHQPSQQQRLAESSPHSKASSLASQAQVDDTVNSSQHHVRTPRTSSTRTEATVDTDATMHSEAWDGSRSIAKHKSAVSTSAATDFSGTSSEWKAQPEFQLVSPSSSVGAAPDVRRPSSSPAAEPPARKSHISHPIDSNLATVKESGESSYYERFRSSGSYSFDGQSGSGHHSVLQQRRRSSGANLTPGGDSSFSASSGSDDRPLPIPPLPQTPLFNPHQVRPDSMVLPPTPGLRDSADVRRLEEEKNDFLRFQEAERKRIEELERSEKRQREMHKQKEDERKRKQVMKRLMSEQTEGSLAPGDSSSSSLKAPVRSRTRSTSSSSSRNRSHSGATSGNASRNGSGPPQTPLPAISTPPAEPLPVPPRTPSAISNRSRSPRVEDISSAKDSSSRSSARERASTPSNEAPQKPNKQTSTRQVNDDSKDSAACPTPSISDSVALLDPALMEEMSRSLHYHHHAFEASVGSWIKHSPEDARKQHSRNGSSEDAVHHHRALSEARKEKRRLKEQGLEGSSWISKVSDKEVGPSMLSPEQMEDLKARPTAHHHPHQVSSGSDQGVDHARNPGQFDKDLPQPPPLSPGVPPKVNRLANKEELADQARRRALAAELAALEQIRVARELQKRLEFELSEVNRRERERSDAENAARAKWAREQAQRNQLDAFERSKLESEERKRRQKVEEIRRVEAERAARVADEKNKADRAEREAIEEAERRKENMLLRDKKLLEEMEARRGEEEKREERKRAGQEQREKIKAELRSRAAEVNGALPNTTPLLKGWLELQPPNSNLWKRRFFHLASDGLSLYKDTTATSSTPLEQCPLPQSSPEDAFEACQMAHSVFLRSNQDEDGDGAMTVAFESAALKDTFVAAVEVLCDGK